ncbi:MAG TPA: MFS transporter [Bacillales bacterium]|nr:MFS transporter [Bacillales bacterium]
MGNHRRSKATVVLFILGILFMAANLRAAITSVGPLIESIRLDMGLSNGLAGFLTTLPLLAFAGLSSLAPKIGHRFGLERVLWFALIVLTSGILIRSVPLVAALFTGTALIGLAIATGNVLLPGLIKQKFPGKVGAMTGMYSTAMGMFASLASGLSIPLAHGLGFGWRGALTCWAVLAVIAAVIWIPQLRAKHQPVRPANERGPLRTLTRSPLAWQVTVFMGLQSFSFYILVTWLSEILHDRGMSLSASGWMVFLIQIVGLPATLLVPMLADRLKNQQGLIAGIGVLYFSGVIGLLSGGSLFLLIVWIICLGLAQGSSISLSLSFLGLRATNARQAAELSGMAQSIGYLLAAAGPILFGFLRDMTHSWTVPLSTLILTGIVMVGAGMGAGRDKYVVPDEEELDHAR